MDELTCVARGEGTTRRCALRSLAAVGAGGLMAAIVEGGTAAANAGAMQFGAANNAVNAKTSLTANLADAVLEASNSGTGVQTAGMLGTTIGNGTGVIGYVSAPTVNGWGVLGHADGADGIALVGLGGHAQLMLAGTVADPTASVETHSAGEVVFDNGTNLWVCVNAGTPGAWRKLASQESAGALHTISPSRVFDSRKPMAAQINTGNVWLVSIAHRIDVANGTVVQPNVVPADATAIAYNLTVVNTVGTNGYLAVNEGNKSEVTASTINWYGTGQTAANGSIVKLNSERQVSVICGGTATATHFIIDVLGYYR